MRGLPVQENPTQATPVMEKNPHKTGDFRRHSDVAGMGADKAGNCPKRGLSRGNAGCNRR